MKQTSTNIGSRLDITEWERPSTGTVQGIKLDPTTKYYRHKPKSVQKMRCIKFSGT